MCISSVLTQHTLCLSEIIYKTHKSLHDSNYILFCVQMDQFILIDLHSAMYADALTTSRPIIAQDVATPADINALVDVITYSKGGSIIRMISRFTGEKAFKLGLKV